jgi:hypothetical protein
LPQPNIPRAASKSVRDKFVREERVRIGGETLRRHLDSDGALLDFLVLVLHDLKANRLLRLAGS